MPNHQIPWFLDDMFDPDRLPAIPDADYDDEQPQALEDTQDLQPLFWV